MSSNGNGRRNGKPTLWEEVARRQEAYDCRCPLRPEMTKRQLLDEVYEHRLYCTAPRGYICSVLDFYLRNAPASQQAVVEQRERLAKLHEQRVAEREEVVA